MDNDHLGAIYSEIIKLREEGVWVPAVENGGLKQLLAELLKRGWIIYPPPIIVP